MGAAAGLPYSVPSMQHRPSATSATARPPLHAAPHPMRRPNGGNFVLRPSPSTNFMNGNTASLLPRSTPGQLISGASGYEGEMDYQAAAQGGTALYEGEMDAQAAAQGTEQGMHPMQEGYFSNLLNEENTNLIFDDNSSLPDNHPTPVVVGTPSSRPNQKRSKNFSEKEDSLIVSAWLNISMDPVYGTNQTRGTFWSRVYEFFYKHKDFPSDRSQKSISHRWASIQENVNKFCGCVTRIEDRRQSGATFQDKLVQALALFKAEDKDKKSFQFMHCWNQLRNQPKWQEKRRRIDAIKQAPNKKSKANMNSSPGSATTIIPDSSDNDIPENSCPEADAPKRPIGKKKAKEALRRGTQGEAYKEASEHFWGKKKEFDAEKEKKEERFNQSLELEKERLRLDEKRAAMKEKNLEIKENELQVKRMIEEERIMIMDITAMPDQLQQYYKSLQADIIARRFSK